MKSVGENVFAALATFEGELSVLQKISWQKMFHFAALNQGRAEAQS
jgi:hypothetical protein